jgi:TonB family protein
MRDRTAFIFSLIFHIGLILYFSISIRAQFKISPQSPQKYMKFNLAPQNQVEPTVKPEPTKPKPEPTKPKPKPTKKKISKDTIKNLQDRLKTPTKKPRKKKTATPRPTRKPRPTVTPKRSAAPTAVPTPDKKMSLTDSQNKPLINSPTSTFSIQGDPNAPYDFNFYSVVLSNQLSRAWNEPTVIRPKRQEYTTIASFTVHRDGHITDIKLVQESGWPILDKSVLQAINKANPVEALPFGYKADSIEVVIPFIKKL